ncbi:MAG: response regulator [Methylococcus sp.]
MPSPTPSRDKPVLLIVDDSAEVLELASHMLMDEYTIKLANSGERALTLASGGCQPDLILLDIMMPGLNGYTVCERLRADPRTEHIPVIFLTAMNSAEDESRGLDLGAVDYVTKPISIPILKARVRNHLELKRARDRLRDQNALLEQQVRERTLELATASAAKSQFLAHMSHELRTPLNAVLGLTELLAREPLAPGPLVMIRHIREAGEALLAMISDILDFSSIEAGQLRIDRQPFTLPPLLTQIEALLRPAAEAKGLCWVMPDPLPEVGALMGDPLHLEQVLSHLLGNAIQFTGQGTVELDIQARPESPGRMRVRFEVRDTGCGIAPELLEELFQPFRQGDASLTRAHGGIGLGLVISQRLVELMGGELGVISREGQGSTFWLEIPFDQAGEDQPMPAAPEPLLKGLRVLAVDDNRLNRLVVERVLQLEGACVTLAADGQQALQLLRTAPQPFDVVLMDVQMPVMDGLTATREIRRDPGLAGLPVVALTAGVLPEEREAALNSGMNDFLAKPLDPKRLAAVLQSYR